MNRIFFALAAGILLAGLAPAALGQTEPFPFTIPWDDSTRTVVDVSRLNPAPIDESRRVRVVDGRFRDRTGRRVRFLGVNLTFSACFPDKPDAEKMAARMRKFGINCVRLHHMDTARAPRGIFMRQVPDSQLIDPDQLDRLDYLVYQLKRHGIYVDLNLHVGRQLTGADGFPDTDKLPRLGKVTAYFVPHMVALQRQYARDILGHRNPYTRMRWADDPVVALVELNNEDSLLGAAWSGVVRDLPPYYRAELCRQWNEWLAGRYRTLDGVRQAWTRGGPLGADMLVDGRFAEPGSWRLQRNPGSEARLAVEEPAGEGELPHGRSARVSVSQLGQEAWHVQLHHGGLTLKEGQTYTLEFAARAEPRRTMHLYAGLDVAPWTHLGLDRDARLTPRWQRFRYVFTAVGPQAGQNRLSFTLGGDRGDVCLADVSLRPGADIELGPGESLDSGSVPLPESPSGTPQGEDYVAFLMEVERRYSQGLRAYIRDTLRSKALVTCSQASYGGLGGIVRESAMDYVDMHAYWQHPRFPRRPWDPVDWDIPNTSMTTAVDGGTLTRLAMHRVAGKPFTVSEYNHPAPNRFRAECLPMLASFAAWQDWDGIFLFAYANDRQTLRDARIKGFFSVDTDPAQMAFLPAAAAIFLRGDVRSMPPNWYPLSVPKADVVKVAARSGGSMTGLWRRYVPQVHQLLGGRLSVSLPFSGEEPGTPAEQGVRQLHVEYDSPRGVSWLRHSPAAGCFAANGPSSLVAVGDLAKGLFTGDFWRIEALAGAPGFGAFTLTALDGKPVDFSVSLLLTAVGDVQNSGVQWNAEGTSVGNRWGKAPTLAAPLTATVTVQLSCASARVYALDGIGRRRQPVPSTLKEGRIVFRIGPASRTLWYEIAAR